MFEPIPRFMAGDLILNKNPLRSAGEGEKFGLATALVDKIFFNSFNIFLVFW